MNPSSPGTPQSSPLGQSVAYASRYDAGLLFPIARAPARAELGIEGALPFRGVDIWNAYELSWLDARGKPRVAVAEFRIPADSPSLIESKSFKLYLNSFNQERIGEAAALRELLERDLSAAAQAPVSAQLTLPSRFAQLAIEELEGQSIDELDVAIDDYGPPDASLLRVADDGAPVEETLVSDLLKSNCPVTGQPDWASLHVRDRGQRIDREGLLRYVVSFREHSGFHEQCVERIHVDLMRRCAPEWLEVYARYTRRGGLDINPWRSNRSGAATNPRGARQ
ncbi:NADPH-dependent 7-cyano-7-deazaguanine reductase QueF [Dokdonella sp.]|uniref:NADPH-dependent 7-cyano-7-deazaguanine reductase QueF n=1 Tax=Dokdonella sp. TaxID=2291710 RepID=UPI002602B907|nr:NADPH-dependent 7-cyano-7-deazaguanine reductase QueF [Dokdonella sp.]